MVGNAQSSKCGQPQPPRQHNASREGGGDHRCPDHPLPQATLESALEREHSLRQSERGRQDCQGQENPAHPLTVCPSIGGLAGGADQGVGESEAGERPRVPRRDRWAPGHEHKKPQAEEPEPSQSPRRGHGLSVTSPPRRPGRNRTTIRKAGGGRPVSRPHRLQPDIDTAGLAPVENREPVVRIRKASSNRPSARPERACVWARAIHAGSLPRHRESPGGGQLWPPGRARPSAGR
jgi:hypothetical protein